MQGVDPGKFTAFNVLEDQDLRDGMYNLKVLEEEWQTDLQQALKSTQIGRRYPNYTLTRSLLVVVTS